MALALYTFFPFLHGRRLRLAHAQYRADPSPQSTVRLAKAQLAASRGSEAFATIADGKSRYPRNAAILRTYKSIRESFARTLCNAALRSLRASGSPENYARAAELLRQTGRLRRAITVAEKGLESFQDHWTLHSVLGQLYLARFNADGSIPDLKAALRHLSRASQLNPYHYKTLINLAAGYARARLYAEARTVVQAILDRIPADTRALCLLAHIDQVTTPASVPYLAAAAPRPTVKSQDADFLSSTSSRLATAMSAAGNPYGVFILDSNGCLIDSIARPDSPFHQPVDVEALQRMARNCKIDVDRIGLGVLASCVISGRNWEVLIRIHEPVEAVAFLEGVGNSTACDRALSQFLAEANSIHA